MRISLSFRIFGIRVSIPLGNLVYFILGLGGVLALLARLFQ